MTMNQASPDDVPVTAALLALALTISKACEFYRRESILAEHFKMLAPIDYVSRCEELFFKTYAEQAKLAGLFLNRVTFEAVIGSEVPHELMCTDYQDMPKTWIFNPYRGWRKA